MPSNQLGIHISLARIGFDSLMALQAKNKVAGQLGVTMPISQFLDGPTIAQLADRLTETIQRESAAAEVPHAADEDAGQAEQWEEGEI